MIKLAHEREIVIIMSPYDTFTIARLINQSIPVRYIMKTDNLVTFNTEDFTDDIQNEMIKHRHRAFPVINKRENVSEQFPEEIFWICTGKK